MKTFEELQIRVIPVDTIKTDSGAVLGGSGIPDGDQAPVRAGVVPTTSGNNPVTDNLD